MPAASAAAPSSAKPAATGVLSRLKRDGGRLGALVRGPPRAAPCVARSAGSSGRRERHADADGEGHDDRARGQRQPDGRKVGADRLEQGIDGLGHAEARRRGRTARRRRPWRRLRRSRSTSTWRRVAPSARSMANSRRRWATVIEKALKMMKAPTNTATPPKASSAGCRNELIDVAACGALLERPPGCAGLHFGRRGQRRADAVAQRVGLTPGAAATSMRSSRPSRPNQRWTSASGASTMMVPPIEARPAKIGRCPRCAGAAGLLRWRYRWCRRVQVHARRRSMLVMATSPSRVGARRRRPTSRSRSAGLPFDWTNVGAPPLLTACRARRRRVVAWTEPSASARRERSAPAREDRRPAGWRPPEASLPARTAAFGVMATDVFW